MREITLAEFKTMLKEKDISPDVLHNLVVDTLIKHNKKVDVIKSVNLPAGVVDSLDIDLYGRNLEIGDIIVMCQMVFQKQK